MLSLSEREIFKIKIGPYVIDICLEGKHCRTFEIPDYIQAFYYDSASEQLIADIQYVIPMEKYSSPNRIRLPDTAPLAYFKEGPYPYEIYRTSSDSFLWIRRDKRRSILLAYEILSNWSKWKLLVDRTSAPGPDNFQELAFLFPYSILNKKGILFHGVVMEWEGAGIIVGAHSGVGKTTHTKLWREYEKVSILNGDRALCYQVEEGWFTCGAPWCGSSGQYINRSAKLSVIVIIEQAPCNQAEQLTPLQAALELLQLTFAPAFDERLLQHVLQAIDNIVQTIPVIKLRCRPDREAVEVLKHRISDLRKLTNERGRGYI